MNHLASMLFDTPAGVVFRLTVQCILIALCGRGALDLLYATHEGRRSGLGRDRNYVAIVAGATIVLGTTWFLEVVRAYSFAAVLAVLVAGVVIFAAASASFRRFLLRPWAEIDATFAAYAAGFCAFALTIGVGQYTQQYVTGMYIQQGWGLPFGLPPNFEPNYGQPIYDPVLYTGHLISAVFGFLGYGNHLLYHEYGTYWLNLLMAPLVPLGALLFFRRFLGIVPAICASAAFCTIALGAKIWSMRGETLGWIAGFAVLLSLLNVLTELEQSGRIPKRGAFVLGVLFFANIVTHGIAAMVGIAAIVLALRSILQSPRLRRAGSVALLGLLAGAVAFGSLYAFTATYAGARLLERPLHAAAGTPDSAVEYNNAWDGLPLTLDVPVVKSAPPYVPPARIAQTTALAPVLSLFDPRTDEVTLRDFPNLMADEIDSTPLLLRILLLTLPVVLVLVYAFGIVPRSDHGFQDLFWIALAIYAAIVAVSVSADAHSIALYPLAATRRSYPYVEFFYWLAVALGIGGVVSAIVRRSYVVIGPRLANVFPAVFVAVWFLYSQSAYSRISNPVAWFSSLASRFQGAASIGENFAPLVDALAVVRSNTRPGDWVYTNVTSSDQTFSYLSDGRYALLEGPSIYQLFRTMHEGSVRMRRFVEFAISADPRTLAPYRVRYVMLYLHPRCMFPACYGSVTYVTNVPLFANNPAFEEVFRNGDYVVYRVTGRPGPERSRRISGLLPVCESNDGSPRARASACTQLISLIGSIDGEPYYYRGRAFVQEQKFAAAIMDFNRAVAINPKNEYAYYDRALAFLALGRTRVAVSDLLLAEGLGGHVELEHEALSRVALDPAAAAGWARVAVLR